MDALAHAIFMLAVTPIIFIYLSIMVAIVQFKGDTSIANFTWGGGVMLVAIYTFVTMSSYSARQILLTIITVLWAIRLIIYLYIRYTGKDPRFKTWKWQGLKALGINIVWVFGQVILIGIMSLPVNIVNTTFNPALTILDFIGLAIWIFGFIFESISDYQLYVFLHNPENKGHVMQYGLWHYSRHPNYFGEVCMWWGVFLIALSVPNGLITIIAPLTITILLRFITGVPMLENAMKDNPEYQEYKKRTNTFVPWFVK